MKKYISIVVLLISGFVMKAQDFEPYTSYGVQVSGRFTGMNSHNTTGNIGGGGISGRGFDAVFHVDKAGAKWFGAGAGLGLSAMGGGGNDLLYYAVVPLRLQLKMGMLWVEPGLENRLFVGMNDRNNPDLINKETVNIYHLAGSFALRFKLFRGLSINTGLSVGITPAVDYKDTDYYAEYGDMNFTTIAGFIGVRYMFNQPY